MKNRRVTRDSTLVYLGTTSLYVHGSSQYNRLQLPAGTIAPDQESIRYNAIGQTSGFGTIQFSPDTSRAIDAYLAHQRDFKEVNSVFGEGTSPKLRKVKMGLRRLGFDPDKLIQHRHHRLRARLRALAGRLVALGHRATVRELWILFARMVFGSGERGDYQRADWYSEALFDRDDRFDFTEALQAVDPAGCSHPIWDAALDARATEVRGGWSLRPPVVAAHPMLDWEDFAALKRRFYFEHEKGEEVFDLADTDEKEFEDLLGGRRGSGQTLVADLVDSSNAAYCPLDFDSREQHLYLWNGHRFHEQPSRSFVAAERVATEDLVTEIPRLPKHLEGCFDYRPDHIALTALKLHHQVDRTL